MHLSVFTLCPIVSSYIFILTCLIEYVLFSLCVTNLDTAIVISILLKLGKFYSSSFYPPGLF